MTKTPSIESIKSDNTIVAKIVKSALSDGSFVYDVHVVDCGAEPMVINATDYLEATALAKHLVDAINRYSINAATFHDAT